MEPTIHCAKPGIGCLGTADDQIVVQPGARLKRRDIVVFNTPPAALQKCGAGGIFVKRLIGMPGDTVHEDSKGFLEIDGKRQSEPYVREASRLTDAAFYGETWHVPTGAYFMVGDNRGESCDSRTWGSVPKRDIIGPVIKIIHRG